MISEENQTEIDVELDDNDLDDTDDKIDWQAEAKKYQGLAKRYQTKLSKMKDQKSEETKTETKKEEKTTELDYGQKAYLAANGIKGADEIALVKEYLASGKELDSIIENKHFQNDLKDLRDEKATKDATPSNSKRSGQSGRDSVEYWIAKGELPPAEDQELRRRVVNAKMKAETQSNVFTRNPVVR